MSASYSESPPQAPAPLPKNHEAGADVELLGGIHRSNRERHT